MSNYNTTLQSNNTDLQEVLEILQNKTGDGEQATPVISVDTSGLVTAVAGSKSSTYQLAFQAAKTITPSTASQVAVSSGYFTGGNITVAAVPTQSKSITPAASAQDVTPDSGKFLSKVTVKGIPSTYVQPSGTLNVTENGTHDVKNYANVNVNVESGSSSGELVDYSEAEDAMVTGTLSSYTNDRITSVRSYAFYGCSKLTSASFPNATTIGSSAFHYCYNLATVSFPQATTIGSSAFNYCYSLATVSFPQATIIRGYAFDHCTELTTADFPQATTIGSNAFNYCTKLTTASFPQATTVSSRAFNYCTKLTTADFPNASTIGSSAFYSCRNLKSLYLTGSSLCTLANSNALSYTPIGGYSASAGTYGSIYVPTSLVDAYKSATNWTYFSRRFVASDGGDTGGEGTPISFISFNIDGWGTFTAESGMTWAEWIESDYNTMGVENKGGCITVDGMSMYDENFDLEILPEDEIIANYTYVAG